MQNSLKARRHCHGSAVPVRSRRMSETIRVPASAVCVVQTAAWVHGCAEFHVAKSCADYGTETLGGFVGYVYVSDE